MGPHNRICLGTWIENCDMIFLYKEMNLFRVILVRNQRFITLLHWMKLVRKTSIAVIVYLPTIILLFIIIIIVKAKKVSIAEDFDGERKTTSAANEKLRARKQTGPNNR